MQEQNYLRKNMKYLRAYRQLNQKAVAQHLQVSTGAYHNYEQGKRSMPAEIIEKLAGLYACNAYDLRHTDMSTLPADTVSTVVPVRKPTELARMDKDALIDYNLAMQQEVQRIRRHLSHCMQWIDNVEHTIGSLRKGVGHYPTGGDTDQ